MVWVLCLVDRIRTVKFWRDVCLQRREARFFRTNALCNCEGEVVARVEGEGGFFMGVSMQAVTRGLSAKSHTNGPHNLHDQVY